LAAVGAGSWGCAEVLDFGDVCEARLQIVDLNLLAIDPTSAEFPCALRSNTPHMIADVRTPQNHPPFPLSVDLARLQVSGVLPAITTGMKLPLLVTFWTPFDDAVPLGYRVGTVDLSGDVCGSPLEVDLRVSGASLETQDDIDAIDPSALPTTDLEAALEWSVRTIDDAGENLDADGDGCSNLREACIGILDDPAHRSACP